MQRGLSISTPWYAIVFTVVMLVMGFLFVYPVHLPISYFDTDFIDYCVGIESLDHKRLKTPYKRSAIAALLPYGLARPFGVINGMGLASIACCLGTFGICVRWLMDLCPKVNVYWVATLVFCSMGPMLSLSRMFNFYPEITVAFFFGAYTTFRLIRQTTVVNALLASAGVVLAFCIDVRGLVWGIPYGVLSVGVLLWSRAWKETFLWVSVLFMGWPIGRFAYHTLHSPLSRQLDVRPLYYKLDPSVLEYAPPYDYPTGFLWGRSSFMDLVSEINFLIEQAFIPTPAAFYSFHAVSESIQSYWWCWMTLTVVSLVWIVRTQGWGTVFCLTPLSPFLFTFWKLPDVVEPHIRFYAQSMPALVIVIAFALLTVAEQTSVRWSIIMASTLFGVSVVFVPGWAVSRVILNAHVKMSIPEAEDVFAENDLGVGYEVHIYTSPITKHEQFLQSSWFEYCNTRLAKDNVMVPFYQRLNGE